MTIDREAYARVLNSQRWRDLRARLLRERGVQCERCRKTWAPGYKHSLQLHHLTYERLGQERDPDVLLVCALCHEIADQERATAAKARAEHALYAARLDGWATRRYGDRWDEAGDPDAIAEEFNAWLEQMD